VNLKFKKVFGSKRDEVIREWRRLHNKGLNALYFSPNIMWEIKSRRLRWVGNVIRMGERRGTDGGLVGRPEGRRRPRRSRLRWEDNIKMNLYKLVWEHGLDRSSSE
jgi:hypothetical protein